MSQQDIIKQLNEKIRGLERPQSKPDSEFYESVTGIAALDAMLPEGGLSGGTLIEWLSPQGGGGSTLGFILAAKLLKPSSVMVVVDSQDKFYPPRVVDLGISLEQVVIIRPSHGAEALWAFEQSLRCSGVSLTMAWIDHITDQVFRRLQLATEAGGGVGFLFRPESIRKQRSWADARFLVEPIAHSLSKNSVTVAEFSLPKKLDNASRLTPLRQLSVKLLHCRGRIECDQVISLEINDETGDVYLAPRLASPKIKPRKARA